MRADTVLVIPFADGIGDFINVQPLIAALKRCFPGTALTVAASEHGNLLINDPDIRVAKPSGFDYEPGRFAIAMRPLLPQKLLAWMAGPVFDRELGPFDLVINFFYAWERGMDFRRYWTPQMPPVAGAVHTLDYLAGEIERELDTNISPVERRPRLAVRPHAVRWAQGFWQGRGFDTARVVGLVPSCNMLIKQWPVDRWLALDAHLREAGFRTLLFCDQANGPVERAFAEAESTAVPIFTPLDSVAALMSLCDAVVSVDTGLLHMAGALGVPWVGLFGPTNPEVTGPYDRSSGVGLVAPFAKERSCGGCWKHFKYQDDSCRTFRGTAQETCLHFLEEPLVLDACLQVLDRGRHSSERAGSRLLPATN